MPRYRLVIEYDGASFVGWQRQANGRSVQSEIEAAIRRFSGEAARVQCAGRTDAGVHASGQVAHVDLAKGRRPDVVRDALNAHLKPAPVVVLMAAIVPDGFDARRSAVRRHYGYRILNRRAPAAIARNAVWHVPRPLDEDRMREAASSLVGRHDFTTFRASECQAASPVRTLERLDVERSGDEILVLASARSFLHSQVRSIVGTLVQVGAGRWRPEQVGLALAARSRAACGPLAPPHGLCLLAVDYPPDSHAEHDDAGHGEFEDEA